MKKILCSILFIFLLFLVSCKSESYLDDNLWAMKEDTKDLKVDTFLIAPTASSGVGNLDYTNSKNKSKFFGACKMQSGIYDEYSRVFAPYYHQALLDTYTLENKQEYINIAYNDIKEAFDTYLNHFNNGNHIIISGYSQGAELALRLLEDYIANDDFYDKYVACYAYGWIVSDDYLAKNERLKVAISATDQKVIISFNTEAIDVKSSFVVKEGEYSNSINPLSWKRDNLVADKELNLGAVFLDTYGNIKNTIENFSGCYIDKDRGTLKVTDVNKEDYPSKISFIEDGVYHLYDYQFFYNNLKQNVYDRTQNI